MVISADISIEIFLEFYWKFDNNLLYLKTGQQPIGLSCLKTFVLDWSSAFQIAWKMGTLLSTQFTKYSCALYSVSRKLDHF